MTDNKTNAEPVAWMDEHNNVCSDAVKKMYEFSHNIASPKNYYKYTIPLYTTPQTKPLSDEEIFSEWNINSYDPKTYTWSDSANEDLILKFARAIEERILGK